MASLLLLSLLLYGIFSFQIYIDPSLWKGWQSLSKTLLIYLLVGVTEEWTDVRLLLLLTQSVCCRLLRESFGSLMVGLCIMFGDAFVRLLRVELYKQLAMSLCGLWCSCPASVVLSATEESDQARHSSRMGWRRCFSVVLTLWAHRKNPQQMDVVHESQSSLIRNCSRRLSVVLTEAEMIVKYVLYAKSNIPIE